MSKEEKKVNGLQDTGNPVLDSLVNLYIGAGTFPFDSAGGLKYMEQVHAKLLELYGKEPEKPKKTMKVA